MRKLGWGGALHIRPIQRVGEFEGGGGGGGGGVAAFNQLNQNKDPLSVN